MTGKLGIPFIYKSSFDKANRSSGKSYRGPGQDEGLQILADVRDQLNVPVLTDVHTIEQVADVAAVVDVLQTPAFLCRQTDFIHACAATLKPVNIKKRSEEHTSELQSLMRISYAVFCLKKKIVTKMHNNK